MDRSVAAIIMAPDSLRKKVDRGAVIIIVHHQQSGDCFPILAITEKIFWEKYSIGRDSRRINMTMIKRENT